jgi:quercetin dioxygenase-like cupin family protein
VKRLALAIALLLAASGAARGEKLVSEGKVTLERKVTKAEVLAVLTGGNQPSAPPAFVTVFVVLEGSIQSGDQKAAAGDVLWAHGAAPYKIAGAKQRPAVLLILTVPRVKTERADVFAYQASSARSLPILDGKGRVDLLIDSTEDGDGAASVSRLRIAKGAQVPEHVHAAELEIVYVVRGTGVMSVGGKVTAVAAGNAYVIPANVKHSFIANEDVEAIQFYAPGGPEQRFKKAAEEIWSRIIELDAAELKKLAAGGPGWGAELFNTGGVGMHLITSVGKLAYDAGGTSTTGVEERDLYVVLDGTARVGESGKKLQALKKGDVISMHSVTLVAYELVGSKKKPARMLHLTVPAKAEADNTIVVAAAKKAAAHKILDGMGTARIVLDADVGGDGSAAVTLLSIRKKAKVPEHVHQRETELLWIVKGRGTITIDGKTYDVKPDTAIHIPPDTKHSFDAAEDVEAVQIYAPGGPEQRFKPAPKDCCAKVKEPE